MAIRDWFRRSNVGVNKASVLGLTAAEMPDKPLERDFDDGALLSTYRDDAWPYILANKIGEQASQAPLLVGRMAKDEFQPVGPEHPVQRLFDGPNPMMEGGEWVHTLLLYMELVGHAPIEVVTTRGGQPAEMYLHNPGPWRIVPRGDGSIRGYLYQVDAGDVRWPTERMTYIRWPNPNNRWYGQGRIAAVRQEVMAEEYAAIRDKKFEKQYGVPPGILTSEMPIGDTTAKELQKRWEQAVGGYTNAGRIAVLGSKTTYQPVSVTPRDAEWIKQRQWRVEALAAAFGVPMPLIRMEGATFSNAEQARAEFWEGTLQPRLNRIARMLTVRLLPLLGAGDLEVRPDYRHIEALGENDLQAAQTAGEWGRTGAVTVDEVRARLSLPAHPDKTIGERLLIPTSVALQSVEDVAAPPVVVPPPEPQRRAIKAEEPAKELLLGPVRAAYRRDLASYFEAMRGALLGEMVRSTKDERTDRLDELLRLLTAKRFRDRLRRITEGPLTESLTMGAVEAARSLGIEASFALPANQSAIDWIGTYLEQSATRIETTTISAVRDVLAEGLRQELDNATVRAQLSELFDGWQDWRIDRITRTETAAAYNVGSLKQYGEAGVTLVRVVDGDGDTGCAAANGALWTLEEAEANPLEHPNCTRTWIPDTSAFRSYLPTATKDRHAELMAALARPQEPPTVNVTIAEGAVAIGRKAPDVVLNPTPIQVAAPDLSPIVEAVQAVEDQIRALQPPPPPTVNVDLSGVAESVGTLRAELRDGLASVKAEVRRPRKRQLIRDEQGRIAGSEDIA